MAVMRIRPQHFSEGAAANNGMHPTADTLLVIFGNLLGRRVMPGVRFLSDGVAQK